MPGAPRFTQKPSIQQTPTGDLLMECQLEADPSPTIIWSHSGDVIASSSRVEQTLTNLSGLSYKATLVIREPNAGDGGAYKCTAKNQFGESNANINLNFAGGGGDESKGRGPSFVGKPRIIPKDGGALIVMECRVKSASVPTARWMKDGAPLTMGGLYHAIFTDLGDQTYLCQLEIRGPSVSDAGNYKCNIKNSEGETNANLALNFEEPDPTEKQEKMTRRSKSPSQRRETASPRPGSPKKSLKSREGTPKRSTKTREGSQEKEKKKSMRSRTSTPTRETEQQNSLLTEETDISRKTSRSEKMEVDQAGGVKRKEGLPPAPSGEEKKARQSSPQPPPKAAEIYKKEQISVEESEKRSSVVEEEHYSRRSSRHEEKMQEDTLTTKRSSLGVDDDSRTSKRTSLTVDEESRSASKHSSLAVDDERSRKSPSPALKKARSPAKDKSKSPAPKARERTPLKKERSASIQSNKAAAQDDEVGPGRGHKGFEGTGNGTGGRKGIHGAKQLVPLECRAPPLRTHFLHMHDKGFRSDFVEDDIAFDAFF